MTPLREDTRLVVPEPPDVISALGDPETELAIAGPARSGQFLIEGDQVTVIGSQRGPIERVRIGPRVVASNIRTEIGSPANLVSLPGVLRREFAGPEGITLEAVVAAPTLPLNWLTARRCAALTSALTSRKTRSTYPLGVAA